MQQVLIMHYEFVQSVAVLHAQLYYKHNNINTLTIKNAKVVIKTLL